MTMNTEHYHYHKHQRYKPPTSCIYSMNENEQKTVSGLRKYNLSSFAEAMLVWSNLLQLCLPLYLPGSGQTVNHLEHVEVPLTIIVIINRKTSTVIVICPLSTKYKIYGFPLEILANQSLTSNY